MTLFTAVLDPGPRLLRYVSAGHDPALLYRGATGEIIETRSTGLPLGMFEGQHYSVLELSVEPGDVLLLSTDGIAEASDLRGVFYGRERLKDDLRELYQRPTREIAEEIQKRVLTFTHPRALTDDLSLVVARLA
jgi:sigma-B regulation protein RsbU (phosphoserine phosphatase)